MDGNHARALLGLPEGAQIDHVRRAFRGAAFVAHPDRGGDGSALDALRAARDVLLAELGEGGAAGATDSAPAGPAALGTRRSPYLDLVDGPARPTLDVRDVVRSPGRAAASARPVDGDDDGFARVLAAALAAA